MLATLNRLFAEAEAKANPNATDWPISLIRMQICGMPTKPAKAAGTGIPRRTNDSAPTVSCRPPGYDRSVRTRLRHMVDLIHRDPVMSHDGARQALTDCRPANAEKAKSSASSARYPHRKHGMHHLEHIIVAPPPRTWRTRPILATLGNDDIIRKAERNDRRTQRNRRQSLQPSNNPPSSTATPAT